MIKKGIQFLNHLNGWQRLFTLVVVIATLVFMSLTYEDLERVDSPSELPDSVHRKLINNEIEKILPEKLPNPNDSAREKVVFLNENLLKKLSYVSESQGTKRAAYQYFRKQLSYYDYLDKKTNESIEEAFGIVGADLLVKNSDLVVNLYALERIKNEINLAIKLPSAATIQFKMEDGRWFSYYGYSQSEISAAYKQASKALKYDYYLILVKTFFYKLLLFIFLIITLYFLGWMLGWVYRGFKSNKKF
jgi:hypothetical protein